MSSKYQELPAFIRKSSLAELIKAKATQEEGLKIAADDLERNAMQTAIDNITIAIEEKTKNGDSGEAQVSKDKPSAKQTKGRGRPSKATKPAPVVPTTSVPEPEAVEKPDDKTTLDECQQYYREKAERQRKRAENPPVKKNTSSKLRDTSLKIYRMVKEHDKFDCEDKTAFKDFMNRFFKELGEYLPMKSLTASPLIEEPKED